MTERVVYTVTEVALMLGLDERTVRRGCQEGSIPAIKVGAKTLIPCGKFHELFGSASAATQPSIAEPAAVQKPLLGLVDLLDVAPASTTVADASVLSERLSSLGLASLPLGKLVRAMINHWPYDLGVDGWRGGDFAEECTLRFLVEHLPLPRLLDRTFVGTKTVSAIVQALDAKGIRLGRECYSGSDAP